MLRTQAWRVAGPSFVRQFPCDHNRFRPHRGHHLDSSRTRRCLPQELSLPQFCGMTGRVNKCDRGRPCPTCAQPKLGRQPRRLSRHRSRPTAPGFDTWPGPDAFDGDDWALSDDRHWRVRAMPEAREALWRDSRWPAFFPSGLCIVTTIADGVPVVEKVVGASVVNRFPYVVALSFCREPLSGRHYARNTFLDAAAASGRVAIQFLMPGKPLKSLLAALTLVPEDEPLRRFACAGLAHARCRKLRNSRVRATPTSCTRAGWSSPAAISKVSRSIRGPSSTSAAIA